MGREVLGLSFSEKRKTIDGFSLIRKQGGKNNRNVSRGRERVFTQMMEKGILRRTGDFRSCSLRVRKQEMRNTSFFFSSVSPLFPSLFSEENLHLEFKKEQKLRTLRQPPSEREVEKKKRREGEKRKTDRGKAAGERRKEREGEKRKERERERERDRKLFLPD